MKLSRALAVNYNTKFGLLGIQKWEPYVRDSVSKLIIDGMKLSLFRIDRMIFQSCVSPSPRSKQMDSSANLTTAGGLAIERTSASCFFLMPLTAVIYTFNIDCGFFVCD